MLSDDENITCARVVDNGGMCFEVQVINLKVRIVSYASLEPDKSDPPVPPMFILITLHF